MEFIIAFLAMLVMDYCYAKYTKTAAHSHKLQASTWATLLIVCNSVVMISVVNNIYTLPAVMAGAFVGTWIAL